MSDSLEIAKQLQDVYDAAMKLAGNPVSHDAAIGALAVAATAAKEIVALKKEYALLQIQLARLGR